MGAELYAMRFQNESRGSDAFSFRLFLFWIRFRTFDLNLDFLLRISWIVIRAQSRTAYLNNSKTSKKMAIYSHLKDNANTQLKLDTRPEQ